MPENVISMSLDASATRKLGADGLFVLWRDGRAPERREGLACILSVCPHSECASQLVYVDGFIIDEAATAVTWGREGVNLFRPDSESAGIALEPNMMDGVFQRTLRVGPEALEDRDRSAAISTPGRVA